MKKVFSNRMNGCSLIHFSFLLAFLFLSVNAEAKVKLPSAPRITLIIRKFYKKHPEKYPLFTFPGVFCLFCCRNSRLTFYF